MTREEILELLNEMGITAEDGNLELSDVVFIHQDTGTKFKLEIDSEGNLSTTKLIDDSLLSRIKKAFGNEAISVGDTNEIRGFVGRLGLATHNNVDIKPGGKKQGEAILEEKTNIRLYSDRIKIGSFYAPALTNKVFGCSHCFIELENTSDEDFPLEGCYLHFARNVNDVAKTSTLKLTGIIPKGGTYLIRAAKKAEFDSPNTFIKITTFD